MSSKLPSTALADPPEPPADDPAAPAEPAEPPEPEVPPLPEPPLPEDPDAPAWPDGAAPEPSPSEEDVHATQIAPPSSPQPNACQLRFATSQGYGANRAARKRHPTPIISEC